MSRADFLNRRRWAIDQQKKARAIYAKRQPERDAAELAKVYARILLSVLMRCQLSQR